MKKITVLPKFRLSVLLIHMQRDPDLHLADAAQEDISVNAAPEQVIMKLSHIVKNNQHLPQEMGQVVQKLNLED